MHKYTSELRADELGINCFSINIPSPAGSNCTFLCSFLYHLWSKWHKNEHKNGQFEPAELAKLFAKHFTTITFYWNIAKRDQVGAAPSRVQMMAVGCQLAFAAWTAVTWFERHLVADILCEPHETKNPHCNPTLLYRHLDLYITNFNMIEFWSFAQFCEHIMAS
jgi:hypothetical protein